MDESKILGVSLRGWLALIIIATACSMAFIGKKVDEPLYSLVMFVAGMYFGQKTSQKPNGDKNVSSQQV